MKKIITLLLLSLIIGCTPIIKDKKINLLGSWKLFKIENSLDKKINYRKSEKIFFFPDSTYAKYNGYEINSGTWYLDKKNNLLMPNTKIKIKSTHKVNNKRIMIGLINLNNSHYKLTWIEDNKIATNFKNDPFYYDNNLWRNKPSNKENNKKLKFRILNYIHHNILIFKKSLSHNNSKVNLKNSKGIFKYHRKGISLIANNKMKLGWINCFYDVYDCLKAYDIIAKYMKPKIKIEKYKNWIDLEYQTLKILFTRIKNANI